MSPLWFAVLSMFIIFTVMFPEDAYNFVTLLEESIKHIPTAVSYQLMKTKLWWLIQFDRIYFKIRLWKVRHRHNRTEPTETNKHD